MEGPLNSPVKGAQQARAFYYNLVDAYLFFLFFFSDAEFVHHFSCKDLEPSYIAVDGGADES